jgi:hypothetical protein
LISKADINPECVKYLLVECNIKGETILHMMEEYENLEKKDSMHTSVLYSLFPNMKQKQWILPVVHRFKEMVKLYEVIPEPAKPSLIYRGVAAAGAMFLGSARTTTENVAEDAIPSAVKNGSPTNQSASGMIAEYNLITPTIKKGQTVEPDAGDITKDAIAPVAKKGSNTIQGAGNMDSIFEKVSEGLSPSSKKDIESIVFHHGSPKDSHGRGIPPEDGGGRTLLLEQIAKKCGVDQKLLINSQFFVPAMWDIVTLGTEILKAAEEKHPGLFDEAKFRKDFEASGLTAFTIACSFIPAAAHLEAIGFTLPQANFLQEFFLRKVLVPSFIHGHYGYMSKENRLLIRATLGMFVVACCAYAFVSCQLTSC